MLILADVVTNDGSGVSGIGLGIPAAFVTDQEESAFVVVAVVVLNDPARGDLVLLHRAIPKKHNPGIPLKVNGNSDDELNGKIWD